MERSARTKLDGSRFSGFKYSIVSPWGSIPIPHMGDIVAPHPGDIHKPGKRSSFFEKRRMEKVEIEWDRTCAGFGIRNNVNGTKNYVAKICARGRARWFTIGSLELVKTSDARELVERMKLIAKSGGDPGVLLAEFHGKGGGKPPDIGDHVSFGMFFERYIEDYAKSQKEGSWHKDKQRVEFHLMTYWRDRPLASIRRADFLAIFTKISKKHPTAANRLKETVTSIFKYAIIAEHYPDNVPLPTFGIPKNKEYPREERIEDCELPGLMRVLKRYPEEGSEAKKESRLLHRNAILLCIFLGLRHGEAKTLRWDMFNFDAGILTLRGRVGKERNTKNSKSLRVVISPALGRLIQTFPRRPGNPYVFPAPGQRNHKSHLARLDKHWEIIRAKAQLDHITIHDLRRTFGCLILDQTGNITIVRDLMNHSETYTTQRYSFYNTQQTAPVLEQYHARLEKLLEC